jgi:rhodanese-related sulfurtransferase
MPTNETGIPRALRAKTAKDLVAEARAVVENLPVEKVARDLAQPGVVLVDLREPGERREQGVIPGAHWVPRGMLEFRADPASPYHDPALDPRRRTILYCASSGRSALAARALQELGYTKVAHLDGGFKAWVAAGQPVTAAPAEA